MSDIVFILGAGASKSAGAPLMYDFLDRAEDLPDVDELYLDDFELVRKARQQLSVVHSKADLDLNNLESVVSAFDMALLLGRAPGLGPEDLERLSAAARRVIAHTLERTIVFKKGEAPPDYRSFAKQLKRLRTEKRCTFSIITFNYDLALDVALAQEGLAIEYCLPGSSGGGNTLLKLHGSMNWIMPNRGKSGNIITYPANSLLEYSNHKPVDFRPPWTRWVEANARQNGHDDWMFAIVPPSWAKGDAFRAFADPWKRAAEELSEATTIVFSGFSLPPGDSYFRYLFALGLGAEGSNGPLLRNVIVFDPSDNVRIRFEQLLGQDSRGKLRFEKATFSALTQRMKDLPGWTLTAT